MDSRYKQQFIHQRPLDSRTRTIFDLKWFRVFSKNRHHGILHCTFFTRKVRTVNVIEGGWALSRLQNAKTSNI